MEVGYKVKIIKLEDFDLDAGLNIGDIGIVDKIKHYGFEDNENEDIIDVKFDLEIPKHSDNYNSNGTYSMYRYMLETIE